MGDYPSLAQSAFDKFERAKTYVDELDIGITSWLGRSHLMRAEFYPELQEACYYVRQVRRVPDYWALLAGDAIHNLRASLDHVVWGLTIGHQQYQPEQPVPVSCLWRRVGFPVQENPRINWQPDQLWGVHPRVKDAIRDEQSIPQGRKGDPMGVLDELWNRDKQRALLSEESSIHVDAWNAPADVLWAAFSKSADNIPGMELERVERVHRGPLAYDKEVEMLRLRFRSFPDESTVRRYMKENAKLTVDIHFDDGSPTFGRGVRPLMREMQDRVEGVLERLVKEFNPRQSRIPTRAHRCPP